MGARAADCDGTFSDDDHAAVGDGHRGGGAVVAAGVTVATGRISRSDKRQAGDRDRVGIRKRGQGIPGKEKPDLMFYRKTASISADLGDKAALLQRIHQKELVEEFMRRWFVDEEAKEFKAAFHPFLTTAEFEIMLEQHLKGLLNNRLREAGRTEQETEGISWHQGSPFRGLESLRASARADFLRQDPCETRVARGAETGVRHKGALSCWRWGVRLRQILAGQGGIIA